MKKTRLPLLIVALLILMPLVTTISTPDVVTAKTQVENSGEEMDGDPDTWDQSPRGIDPKPGIPPELSPSRDQSLGLFQLAIGLWIWTKAILRLP